MGNVLDLKEQREARRPGIPSPDGISRPPEPEPLPDDSEDPSEVNEYLSSLRSPFVEQAAWKAPVRTDELERRKEHALLATLGAIGFGVAIWSGSLALVFIIILTVVTWEVYHHGQHEVQVHVDTEGISVNGYKHPYARLKSFSLQEMPDRSWHLSIKPATFLSPDIRAPLGEQDRGQVRAILSQYLIEEEHPIPLSELFLKS